MAVSTTGAPAGAAAGSRRPASPRRPHAPGGARPMLNRTGFRALFLAPGGIALLLGLDAALTLLGLPALLGPALSLDRLPEVHGTLMVLPVRR